jgi:hypothetical protein
MFVYGLESSVQRGIISGEVVTSFKEWGHVVTSFKEWCPQNRALQRCSGGGARDST